MSYQLKVMKDHPMAFWALDELSGDVAYDSSPCGNNATYYGSLDTTRLPLVSGGGHATKITETNYISYSIENNYQGSSIGGSFGNLDSSDNDFSLECWYYPASLDSDYQLLFGDSNQCSIQINESNVQFIVQDEVLQYTLPNQKKNTHVVATYHPSRISLYIDGRIVASKTISGFKFLNETLTIESIASGSSYFLIDAPAIYRYELTENIIKDHYNSNVSIEPIHIVSPDGGRLIEFYDNNISTKFKYMYPLSKSWDNLVADGLVYDQDNNLLKMQYVAEGGNKEVEVIDFVSMPIDLYDIWPINKVQWISSGGVSVHISYDGESYTELVNRAANQIESNEFYIKIKFTSANASEFLPAISSFAVKFMSSDLTVYSKNTGTTASGFVDSSILDKSHILGRDYFNGIFCSEGGTFDIADIPSINSIEFLYTPYQLLGLRSAAFPAGDIYVNGELNTSTNMSDIFNLSDIHHVVINCEDVSDLSDFNSSGNSALFQNVALYETQLSSEAISNHYNLYVGRPSILAEELSFTVTENAFKAYNNNWTVIQNS